MTSAAAKKLAVLADEIVGCRKCPRLVAHREEVGRTKRRAYASETYWAKPLPGFGDPKAKLLIVGLAPGAHGANRTGRVFTGDRSGDFLYAALHRAKIASQPDSKSKNDGLTLKGAFITMPCRCVPPDNKPLPIELSTCRPWLEREIALLPDVRSVLALGSIAYAAMLRFDGAKDAPPFAHGATTSIRLGKREVALVASYHVSQQNTQTGRLTPAMFDRVLQCVIEASCP
ncbi:MAG: uracil-DNA glycosylase [Polyangiaceae bacterium]|nr:uracil-DNA glycosylase [Polyangiaceae bacterium]